MLDNTYEFVPNANLLENQYDKFVLVNQAESNEENKDTGNGFSFFMIQLLFKINKKIVC